MVMPSRPRRNRGSTALRELVAETILRPSQFIMPLFITAGHNAHSPIASMPGYARLSLDLAIQEIKAARALGIRGFALFPVIPDSQKSADAREAVNPKGFLPEAVKRIKDALPDTLLITDVALDPYSSDGHDGIVKNGKIVNDESLPILAEMAVVQAAAGADIVAPSDMMDGRVAAMRQALDSAGYQDVAILSYTAKYASAFYGPFRDALDSAPRHGDKKTYQMDVRNSREALREIALDEAEGADILMVKPALAYLDVIRLMRDHTALPIAAYQVSGEYAMIKAAAANGWLDERATMLETLTAIRRAGADMIFTYFAKEAAKILAT